MSITKSSKHKIIGIIVICVVVCSIASTLAMGGCAAMFLGSGGPVVQTSSDEFKASDVKSIDIDFPAGELIVRASGSNADSITVVEESTRAGATDLKCELKDGRLSVRYNTNFFSGLLWFLNGKKVLTVTIPKGSEQQFESFNLELAAGSASVNDVSAHAFKVDMAAGEASFGNIKAEQTSLSMAAGKINASNSDLGKVTTDVSAGECTVKAAMRSVDADLKTGRIDLACLTLPIDSIRADVTTGALTIAVPDDCGFSAAFDKTTGSIDCDFNCTVRGNVYEYGDGSTPIDIHVTTGSATLKPLN